MNAAPLLLLTVGLLCGCATTHTVTRAQLESGTKVMDGFTFPDRTYYCGAKDGFDYFAIQRGMGGSERRCRVPETDMAVTTRFPFSEDRTRWQVYHDVTQPSTNHIWLQH
jgi:hypothetical protein